MDCPACNAPLTEHETTIDGPAFECPTHGMFGVARSAWVSRGGFENESADVRAKAFANASQRGARDGDPFPIITTYDYF